jgi:hypothetical protein
MTKGPDNQKLTIRQKTGQCFVIVPITSISLITEK